MRTNRHITRALGSALFLLLGLLAPTALAQIPAPACGAPPQPITGSIPFTDITQSLGYQVINKPTSDTMSDYIGGYDAYCYVSGTGNYSDGPWAQPELAGTIALPFPFGFSGIYSDGGIFSTPFQVNVWANGILTFDPSVSFDPFAYPQQLAPPGCSGSFGPESYTVYNGAVTDVFGGFPFLHQYPSPNALIAPWWGDLSLCPGNGSVGWLFTLDDDGVPMAIIQWTNATASDAPPNCGTNCYNQIDFSACTNPQGSALYPGAHLPQFTFQVRLHQNNDVDFIYGPSSNLSKPACYQAGVGVCSYLSGIQSNLIYPNGVRPGLVDYAVESFDCGVNSAGPGCMPGQFPTSGTSITYHDVFRSVGPDVLITGITSPGLVPQGSTVQVPIQLSNGGGTDSTGQGQLQFYFSAGGQTPTGAPFAIQGVPPLQACAIQPLRVPVTIPATIPPGPGYLIAEFTPGAESIDQTPSYANTAVVIGPPTPDLAVQGSLAFNPAAAVGGEQVSFDFIVANVGEVDVPAASYGIYVSLGGNISSSDIQIGTGMLPALASGASTEPKPTFSIPLTLVSGDYLIGVIVDPDNALGEVNQTNNVATGKKLFPITSLGPVITTAALPNAQTSAPYSVQIIAGGGDGKYSWSLAGGALPSGLALTKAGPSAGLISGQAANVGVSNFTVKVTDGVGHSATQSLNLTVDPFEQTLSIVTLTLPGGSTAQLYNYELSAVGGTPPYQWAVVPGAGDLPVGINLIANGLLTGEPQYDQTASFRVTVTDAKGTVVLSPTYSLTIFSGGTLAVGSTVLPPATLNVSYTATLHYAGGVGPYTWTVTSVDREPGSPSDSVQHIGSGLDSLGLSFFSDQGVIEGTPNRVGVYAISVEVIDSETPTVTADGLVLLTISAKAGFAFQTVQLPTANANAYYQASLATNAQSSAVLTFQLLDTAQLATNAAKDTLPADLVLYPDGTIQGVPLEAGHFPFLVEVQDGLGGIATQSFSIDVVNDYKPSSGCQSAPGAPAFAGLMLLALTRLGRRSRSKR